MRQSVKTLTESKLVSGQSARLVCGYVYSSAGGGESTQDIVFSAHNLICENGTVLAEAHKFADESVYADIDVQRICSERRRMSTYAVVENSSYTEVKAQELIDKDLELIRYFDKAPFVPSDKKGEIQDVRRFLIYSLTDLRRDLNIPIVKMR